MVLLYLTVLLRLLGRIDVYVHSAVPSQRANQRRRAVEINKYYLFVRMSTPADEKAEFGKTAVVTSVAESDPGLEQDKLSKEEVSSVDEPQYDFDSEEFAGIPDLVRNVVSFEDDPTLPVITFRSVLLSVVFCVIGSVISQIS